MNNILLLDSYMERYVKAEEIYDAIKYIYDNQDDLQESYPEFLSAINYLVAMLVMCLSNTGQYKWAFDPVELNKWLVKTIAAWSYNSNENLLVLQAYLRPEELDES